MRVESAKRSQILKDLKTEILAGHYKPTAPFPSEVALSRRYKVSRGTIAFVVEELKRQGLVSRRRGSGTFVTKQGSSRFIGLVVPGVSYSSKYFQKIVSALIQEAQKNDYSIVVDGVWTDDAEGNSHEAIEVAARLIRRKVAGIIYQPVEHSKSSDEVNRRILAAFTRAHIPVVLLDSDIVTWPKRSEYDLVSIDDVAAGTVLAELMMDGGARNIHFITRQLVANVSNRIRGVRDAVLARGLKWDDAHVTVADPNKKGIARALMRRRPRPDAFVCENDKLAAKLMAALDKLGYKVPKDVQLAGFDDREFAQQFTPTMTTVNQPSADLAVAAFKRLMERMRDPSASPTHKVLPFVLVEKDSTLRRQANRVNPRKSIKGVPSKASK